MAAGGFDRIIRKFIPSLARLSYSPAFKLAVDAIDAPLRFAIKDFRHLPPNHLRIRVGVGNRLFSNQPVYLGLAKNFWLATALERLWRWDSTIVDVGCGCGRFAHYLRDLRSSYDEFHGKYFGIDIDDELLAWCRANFDQERFAFIKSTDSSLSYNTPDSDKPPFHLPLDDQSADFVFSHSLFTHLLEDELTNYIRESYRVLKAGGAMHMSVFCLEYPPRTFGARHTFSHRIGQAYVESTQQPEAAVAYHEPFLTGEARAAGFVTAEIRVHPSELQAVLLCRK